MAYATRRRSESRTICAAIRTPASSGRQARPLAAAALAQVSAGQRRAADVGHADHTIEPGREIRDAASLRRRPASSIQRRRGALCLRNCGPAAIERDGCSPASPGPCATGTSREAASSGTGTIDTLCTGLSPDPLRPQQDREGATRAMTSRSSTPAFRRVHRQRALRLRLEVVPLHYTYKGARSHVRHLTTGAALRRAGRARTRAAAPRRRTDPTANVRDIPIAPAEI